MAMFNFDFEPAQKEVRKPMRSYIDIDESGRPKARIYADEYDAVKSNPDFQPYLTSAGRNMETAQTAFNDEMQEARIQAVEKRIQAKKQEAVSAELAASEAAGTGNEYPGIDILGRMIGSKTFAQRATSRQEELRKLLEQRAALEGTPEISAPMTEPVEAAPTEAVAPAKPQQPVVNQEVVRVRDPRGVIGNYPKAVWQQNSKQLIERGYVLLP